MMSKKIECMKEIKQQIIDLMYKSAEKVHSAGSYGELGDSFDALDAECFAVVATEITSLIQIIFDPENQPNQLGINNPFAVNVDNNFKGAVEPAIRYLFNNHNPHTKIYIDYDKAELLQGQQCDDLTAEVPD